MEKKWYQKYKVQLTIVTGIVTVVCQVIKIQYPDFDADYMTKVVLGFYASLMGSHTITDVSHNLKK